MSPMHPDGNRRRSPHRQQGVAVITALLLTTLAVTIVASLFWQQQVQVRSMENQRLQLQTKWILRGALDWARLILREDGRLTNVDTLDEPWAVPLADTRLDEYVEKGNEGDQSDAVLSGQIVDAQSRYNLNNLVKNRVIDKKEVAVFAQLLNNLRLKPELAQATAEAIRQGQAAQARLGAPAANQGNQDSQNNQSNQGNQPADANAQAASASGAGNASANASTGQLDLGAPKVVALSQVDDLLVVPGMTSEILTVLRDYVIFLPEFTPINVNTASAPVLAARVGFSLADATARVSERERASYKDYSDAVDRFHLPTNIPKPMQTEVDVTTNYFIVYGKVRLGRATQEMYALVERKKNTGARVIWIRES